MPDRDARRLQYYARRLDELRTWRNARELPIRYWRFTAPDGEVRKLELGDRWPAVEVPVSFSASAAVPAEWRGEPVELDLWLGGEGFVRLSNGVEGGLDPFHRRFPVADSAAGGERVEIEAEVVPKGLFGSHVAEPRLTRAHLVVPEVGVRALERDLSVIVEACRYLGDHEAVPLLLDAVEAAFRRLAPDWPSRTDIALARYRERYKNTMGRAFWSLPPVFEDEALDVEQEGLELWSLPPGIGDLEPLSERARAAVRAARAEVARRLEEIREEYPPAGRLALSGHAHIDLAWLWPLQETRRKARRTFSSVLHLMEEYGEFTFNQSSARLYAWVEEEHPELFERIRRRVAEGRWEPVGGSWTEPDCQMPGGEAFVRQLLYGQRYFEEKFGRRCKVAWLPDAFGFSPGIPQLLRGAGLSGFFTCKLKWNEANRFPHNLFVWEGIDGSTITAHTMENPGSDYNGNVAPSDLLGTWRNYTGKRYHPESLFTFGWGDGGGGPSRKMLENYERLRDFPALPRLRSVRVEDFFESLPRAGLPKWVGELYLELHRGTLTSQGRVKKLNREAEHRLLEAEAFALIAGFCGFEYPREELEGVWKTLLLNQFHDILPGSSIREVYQEAHRQLAGAVESATRIRDAALRHLAERVEGPQEADGVLLVANAALRPRPLSAVLPELEGGELVDARGEPLPVQKTRDGLLVHDPGREVPGLGWVALFVRRGAERMPGAGVRVRESGGGAVLENGEIRAEIGHDGALHSLYDRVAEREVLDGRGNLLLACTDKPREWDAWDIEERYELECEEVGGMEEVRVTESGPLEAAVRTTRRWRSSRIEQTYRLRAGSRRLDIETRVDWRERQVLLRALFPLAVRSHEATFETMYGAVRRPTHRNTSWDAARFEVSAHRFADLSETGYGAALLNDGKYGHSARDNVLGISLLRSPVHPDPTADEGEHRFTYSLLPHAGDWTAGVAREAFGLNSPLFAVVLEPGSGSVPVESGLVRNEGLELALGGLKRAEDGEDVILRLYEPHGARGTAVLRFARPLERALQTNLLEELEEEVAVEGDTIRVSVRPFEVLTLRLSLARDNL